MFGTREEFVLQKIYYPFANSVRRIKFFFKWKIKKNIQLNNAYRNINNGRRCFIVGNGPSLKTQDLSLLRDEYVFTVNEIMQSDVLYTSLQSNYHVLVDPCYFNKQGCEYLLPLIQKAHRIKKDTVFFVDYRAKQSFDTMYNFIEKRYFYSLLDILPQSKSKINLASATYHCQTVIQTAIYIALYMGFSEIYLLGCDMTGFLEYYEKTDHLKQEKFKHAYERNKEQEKMLSSLGYSNEFWLKAFGKMFEIYNSIKTNISNNYPGVKIINLTRGGALDVFERKEYEEVVSDIKRKT